MGLRSSATANGASVLLRISSTVTPSAISIKVKPLVKLTSKTPCNESWLANAYLWEKEHKGVNELMTYQLGDDK